MSVTKLPTIAAMLIIFCLALIVSASCLEPRIIGGVPTTITKHPYQVSIHYNGKLACGGSIIGKQWILTAAHCVYGGTRSLFRVRVASSYHDEGGILITDIASIIVHNKYTSSTYDYDVALIKLSTPLTLGSNVKLIVLALSSSNIKPGRTAIVAGWGKTSVNSASSKILQSLVIPIVDEEVCRKIYARYRTVTSNMLCAGFTTGEKDTCQGDSGGALVYNGVQIGIVSWGAQCASVGFPGVYTRISAIRQWITEQANV
ncbi:trypsin-1-like [Pogonomyrmex barbatus]|uniref:Trypsin-1-like n=1 Tax=Pogonomyrmex barbatus TaxID=144034 RepID=A0A6I9WZY8_9HYME|nr:trypsin-1-like [Pogonomyrmex barbatus]